MSQSPLSNIHSRQDFNQKLRGTTVSVSFWKGRKFAVEGKECTMRDLVRKVEEWADVSGQNTPDDWIEMMARIHVLDERGEKAVKDAGLAKWMVRLRQWFGNIQYSHKKHYQATLQKEANRRHENLNSVADLIKQKVDILREVAQQPSAPSPVGPSAPPVPPSTPTQSQEKEKQERQQEFEKKINTMSWDDFFSTYPLSQPAENQEQEQEAWYNFSIKIGGEFQEKTAAEARQFIKENLTKAEGLERKKAFLQLFFQHSLPLATTKDQKVRAISTLYTSFQSLFNEILQDETEKKECLVAIIKECFRQQNRVWLKAGQDPTSVGHGVMHQGFTSPSSKEIPTLQADVYLGYLGFKGNIPEEVCEGFGLLLQDVQDTLLGNAKDWLTKKKVDTWQSAAAVIEKERPKNLADFKRDQTHLKCGITINIEAGDFENLSFFLEEMSKLRSVVALRLPSIRIGGEDPKRQLTIKEDPGLSNAIQKIIDNNPCLFELQLPYAFDDDLIDKYENLWEQTLEDRSKDTNYDPVTNLLSISDAEA